MDRVVLYASFALAGASLPLWLSTLPDFTLVLMTGAALSLISVKWHGFRYPLVGVLAFGWVSWYASALLAERLPEALEKLPLDVVGTVGGLPEHHEGRSRFFLDLDRAVPGWPGSASVTILLNCYECEFLPQAGERLALSVRLKRPNGFRSPGAFDYEKWLFRRGVRATGYVTAYSGLIDPAPQGISSWRSRLRQAIADLGPGRGRALVRALVVGDRSGLSADDWHTLRLTGVSHLVAISGLHIGLVALGMLWISRLGLNLVPRLFLVLPRPWLSHVLVFTAAASYAAVAGFSIPTQRALLMLGLYITSSWLGRDRTLMQLLFTTVLILIVLDPLVAFDASFWLSFGAVFLIAWGARAGNSITSGWIGLQSRLWFGLMPVIILLFGNASLIAPIANLLAVPVISLVVLPVALFAAIMKVAGLDVFFLFLVEIAAWVADLLMPALDALAGLPAASIRYVPITGMEAVILVLLAVILCSPFQLVGPMFYLAIALSISLPGNIGLDPGEYRAVFLDVGQGLAVTIETRSHTVVYDTGASWGEFDLGQAVVLPYLRASGRLEVDVLVISHGDNDHIGGAASLLGHTSPTTILSSVPNRLPGARACQAGQSWDFDEVRFQVLGPDKSTPPGSNNRSCVLKVTGTGGSLLVTGDIEREVEGDLVTRQRESLAAEFLLVPHQGSRTSSRPVFIEAVDPEIAVVSTGYLNSYGHPHADVAGRYQARDIPLFNTAEKGSVLLHVGIAGHRIESWRDQQRRFWHR